MSDDARGPEEPEGDIFELLASLFGGDRESMERALSESGINPAELQAMSAQMPALPSGMEQMFSALTGSGPSQGPVNWELAHNIARQTAVAECYPSVGPRVEKDCREALNVAELWLNPATNLPAAAITQRVWSRSEWVEATLDTWRKLTEPIATSVADAMSEVMREAGMEMGAAPGLGVDPTEMLRQFGGAVFGMQVGSAVGTLAQEVLGAGDIGLALTA